MINKKMYYSISEVCELTGLEQHVLRYWEKEIPKLRPKKNSAGNRAYREKDIELIRNIKHLLYEEEMSVQEVKQHLTEGRKSAKQDAPRAEEPVQAQLDLLLKPPVDKPAPPSQSGLLAEIREGLEEVLALLA